MFQIVNVLYRIKLTIFCVKTETCAALGNEEW